MARDAGFHVPPGIPASSTLDARTGPDSTGVRPWDARESPGPTGEPPITHTSTGRAACVALACVSILTAAAAGQTPPPQTAARHHEHPVLAAVDTDDRDQADLRGLARTSRAATRVAAVPTPPPTPAPASVASPVNTPAPRPRPGAPRPTPRRTSRAAPAPAPAGNLSAVIAFALAQVGDRYVMGATGPTSWDCSGLVAAAYARIGIRLPHNAAAMLAYGRAVSRDQLAPGDLVITEGGGHVAIYIGHGWIVEAANPRVGVVARPMWGFDAGRRLT